jgi:hypothetical protein
MQNKYCYVTMTASDAEVVVRAAGKFKRELNINNDGTPCEVTYRPLFGFGVFNRRRPFYVLAVCRHTCVCVMCYGARLIFRAFIEYRFWVDVCPAMQELQDDVVRTAGNLSPTIDTLLECLLCDRDPDTDFFPKACCSGTCVDHRWVRSSAVYTYLGSS